MFHESPALLLLLLTKRTSAAPLVFTLIFVVASKVVNLPDSWLTAPIVVLLILPPVISTVLEDKSLIVVAPLRFTFPSTVNVLDKYVASVTLNVPTNVESPVTLNLSAK